MEGYNDEKKKRRLVFLDNLLSHKNSGQLSLDDVQEEVDTFMFAVCLYLRSFYILIMNPTRDMIRLLPL